MSLTVVTGAWGPRRVDYAKPFAESFDRHWPRSVKLVIYTDGKIPVPDWAEVRLIDKCEGYTAFMTRHAGDPVKSGQKPAPGAHWKASCLAKGYNFRFDALRFAGQGFIPDDAAQRMNDGDVLCWLDADVVTRRAVSEDWVEGLIGLADGAYLGRAPKHSEIGFWAVRLGIATRAFLHDFATAYRTDAVFDLREWHSAYAWDDARRRAGRYGAVNMRDLTPGGHGHVFAMSPLASHLIHNKGLRKGFR